MAITQDQASEIRIETNKIVTNIAARAVLNYLRDGDVKSAKRRLRYMDIHIDDTPYKRCVVRYLRRRLPQPSLWQRYRLVVLAIMVVLLVVVLALAMLQTQAAYEAMRGSLLP